MPRPTRREPLTAGGGQRGPGCPALVMTIRAFHDGAPIPRNTLRPETRPHRQTRDQRPAGPVNVPFCQMHGPEKVPANRTTEDRTSLAVWNIPAQQRDIPEGIPMGAQVAERPHTNLARAVRFIEGPVTVQPVRETSLHLLNFRFGHEGECPALANDAFETR